MMIFLSIVIVIIGAVILIKSMNAGNPQAGAVGGCVTMFGLFFVLCAVIVAVATGGCGGTNEHKIGNSCYVCDDSDNNCEIK